MKLKMENLTDKIQDYIDGLLQGEDLAHFESQMAVDDELRNLVSLHKEVHTIINRRLDSKEDELRSNLANARAHVSTAPKSNKIFKLYMPIAAAACLLVFFSIFYFGKDDGLYDLPTMQSEIVRGQTGNVTYEDAVNAFNNASYIEAREMLHTLITQDSMQIQYRYYAALTYFGEENWSSSIEELTPLAEGKSIFADEAKYYLAVSYLKIDQRSNALEWLDRIPFEGKLGDKKAKLLKEIGF